MEFGILKRVYMFGFMVLRKTFDEAWVDILHDIRLIKSKGMIW